MPRQSKRYKQSVEVVDIDRLHSLNEAFEQMLLMPAAKFDESVDIAINLGVDPKHADQMVRGAIVLPHGVGKDVRVLVFAKGDKEKEAQDAGADHVGGDELAKKIQDEGWLEFDRVIATPDMMGVVGRLGKVLGPRGLMPNPKSGTVTDDIAEGIKLVKAGRVEFKMDKTANVAVVIGKRSFTAEQIVENAEAAITALVEARPASHKGKYLKSLTLSATMSPGISVDALTYNKA